jgi:hypothetical protein
LTEQRDGISLAPVGNVRPPLEDPAMNARTQVTTAAGELKSFGDAASRFIVAHPKTAVVLAALAANFVGVIFHL